MKYAITNSQEHLFTGTISEIKDQFHKAPRFLEMILTTISHIEMEPACCGINLSNGLSINKA